MLKKEFALDDLLNQVTPDEMSLELESSILASIEVDEKSKEPDKNNIVTLDRNEKPSLFAGSFTFGGLAIAASVALMIFISLPDSEPTNSTSGMEYASYEADEEKQVDQEIDDFLSELLEEDEDIDELLEIL